MREIVLEKSTNTHKVRGPITGVQNFENGDVFFEGKGVVLHDEHGCIVTESSCLKINQQELNPVTKSLQNAYD